MARSRILLGACVLCVALPGLTIAQQPDVDPVSVGTVADKLGAKVLPSAPRELGLGRMATTTSRTRRHRLSRAAARWLLAEMSYGWPTARHSPRRAGDSDRATPVRHRVRCRCPHMGSVPN